MTKFINSSNITTTKITSGDGFLAKLWGTLDNAVNNIIGLSVLVLLLFAIIYTFVYPWILTWGIKTDNVISSKDVWGFTLTALLSAGTYLIGSKTKK